MTLKAFTYRLASAASTLPFSILRKAAGDDLLIPVYHTVSDQDLPHISHLYVHKTVRQFISDIEFFIANYTPISLGELLQSRQNKKKLPSNAVLLTFDDGLREVVDVIAPILSQRNVPAVFFLATAFLDNRELFYKHKASLLAENLGNTAHRRDDIEQVQQLLLRRQLDSHDIKAALLSISYQERHLLDEIAGFLRVDFSQYLRDVQPYLATQQVRQLIEQGFAIGAHSVDHPEYSSLTLLDQLEQTRQSLRFLTQEFSLDYQAFAFPFNDRGISRDFFDRIEMEREVDLLFGTSSMMQDDSCVQRTIMETLPVPAPSMIVARYARKFVRKLARRNEIDRQPHHELVLEAKRNLQTGEPSVEVTRA